MSALLHIPTRELLALWTELVEARYGRNRFGGHVAELYAYRFHCEGIYVAGLRLKGESNRDEVKASDIKAMDGLVALLQLFEEENPDIVIMIRCGRFPDGSGYDVPFDPAGLRGERFEHRLHIVIVERSEAMVRIPKGHSPLYGPEGRLCGSHGPATDEQIPSQLVPLFRSDTPKASE